MEKNPTEFFIREKMAIQNGTLAKNFKVQNEPNHQLVNGKEESAESLGFWLQYALLRKDPLLFQQRYQLLTKGFVDWDGFIYSKGDPSGEKIVYVNSLVDDLRIIESLFNAASLWKDPQYQSSALTISKFISTRNKRENLLVDFYDKNTCQHSSILTLSYINPLALKKMKVHGVIDIKTYISMIDLLDQIPKQNGFYAKSYNIKEKKFVYDSDINMVDQAFIALHQAEEGAPPSSFFSFIKKEFAQNGAICGMYKKDSKLPTVHFESPALYGITILYCLKIGEGELAYSLYKRMIQFRENNPQSPYYGGYSVKNNGNIHIFDNLVPILAEEGLTMIKQ